MASDYRLRNYMAPQNYGGFNIATGAGPWATPPMVPKPFTGMPIQGPLPAPNSFARPEIAMPEPIAEPVGFRGMEIQGPLGSTPGVPNYEAPRRTGSVISRNGEQEQDSDKEFDIFEHMYNAPTPALEAYKRHIMSMPRQEDYKAGKMDRFIAALTGASEGMRKGGGAGYAAARGVVDTKYNQALQNYSNQGQGLGQLAELESNDMKSKMAYAKTAMEQRRADAKEARESRMDEVDIETKRKQLEIIGKDLETSSADGQMYVVDKTTGTRTPIGKFKLTPEEEAKIQGDKEIRVHGANAGTDFGYDKAMEGIEFANRVGLFGIEEGTRSKNRVSEHAANRAFDAANPIPTAGFDFTAPSQHKIAFETALGEVLLNNPAWNKFIDPNTNTIKTREQEKDTTGYQAFITAVQNQRDRIIASGARRPVGAAPRPEVKLPTVAQSPLNAPSAPDSPDRERAIKILQDKGEPVTPEMIDWVMKQPAFRQ